MSGPGDLSGFRPCESFKTSLHVKLTSVSCCFTPLFGHFGNTAVFSFVKTLLENLLKSFALFRFSFIITGH